MSTPFDDVFDTEDSPAPPARASAGASASRPGAAALQHRRRIEEYWEMRRLRDQIGDLADAAGGSERPHRKR